MPPVRRHRSRKRTPALTRSPAPSIDRFGPPGQPVSDFTPSNHPLSLSHHHHPPTPCTPTPPPTHPHGHPQRDETPIHGPSRCYSAHTTPPRPARHHQAVGGAARPVEVGTSAAQPGLKFASCPCCHHHHHNHRPPPYTWLFGTSIEAPVHVPTLCNRQTHGGPLPTTHHHPKLWCRCLGSRATHGRWQGEPV